MQILKEEVKNKIRGAAILEFREKGYEKASMRSIAEAAEISVGNVYRYFKNKETLFDYIVAPVYEMLTMHPQLPMNFQFIEFNFLENQEVLTRLILARKTYRDELNILLSKSKGSKYEDAKLKLIEFIQKNFEHFIRDKINQNKKIVDEITFSKAFAISLVEGASYLIETSTDDTTFVRSIIQYMELTVKSTVRHLFGLKNGSINFRRIKDEEINNYFRSGHPFRHHHCTKNHAEQ